MIDTWGIKVLYGRSVWYTIKNTELSITFASGMFPKYETIAADISKGCNVSLEMIKNSPHG